MGSDQDGVPSKVSDSGVGGLESGEDSWISDTEVSNILRIVSFRRKKDLRFYSLCTVASSVHGLRF